MAIAYNSNIATGNLVFCIDAGNPRSYAGSYFNNVGSATTVGSQQAGRANFVNGPTYTSNNLGSVVFDGINDFLTVLITNGFGTVSTAPVCTMTLWAKVSRKPGGGQRYQQLAGFRNSGFDFYFLIADDSLATVPTEARVTTLNGAFDITTNYTTFDVWTHIGLVANTNRLDLYYNGVLVGSNTNVTGVFGSNSGSFRIGAGSIAAAYPTLGNISMVQFYTSALTQQQIVQNFNASRGRYGI